MSLQRIMRRLARWHIWVGWVAGFPILMWTITGLVMVARPIEEVRGESLRAPVPTIETSRLAVPQLDGPIQGATLVQLPRGPMWIVTDRDGAQYRYSARDGVLFPPVARDEAESIARAAYIGKGSLQNLTYFPADVAPLELRRKLPSWRARFSDDTNVYLAANTGEILALRTGGWRVYDFMWGLHIMDLRTREDTHHPLLIGFAAVSVVGALFGCILLFRRRKARATRAPAQQESA